MFSLVYSLWACAVGYLVESNCLVIWNFRRHYFRFRSLKCYRDFKKIMWTENQVKNKLKNVGFFAKISDNFIQVFYSGRVHNFKTAKLKHNLPWNFRENLIFVCGPFFSKSHLCCYGNADCDTSTTNWRGVTIFISGWNLMMSG